MLSFPCSLTETYARCLSFRFIDDSQFATCPDNPRIGLYPVFLKINKGCLLALDAASQHCPQNERISFPLTSFRTFHRSAETYPFLHSTENILVKNSPSGRILMISPRKFVIFLHNGGHSATTRASPENVWLLSSVNPFRQKFTRLSFERRSFAFISHI